MEKNFQLISLNTHIGEKLVNEIQPIDYNYYNLDRDERFDFSFKKSCELIEFCDKYKILNPLERSYLQG